MHHQTDSIVKALLQAASEGDYAAALALLDHLSETGHDDFAEMLRYTVTIQPHATDSWRARFVSWQVEDYMSGKRVLTKCCHCGNKTCGQPSFLFLVGWMVDRSSEEEKAFCPNCHRCYSDFWKVFSP
jgi:hypothetical protein